MHKQTLMNILPEIGETEMSAEDFRAVVDLDLNAALEVLRHRRAPLD